MGASQGEEEEEEEEEGDDGQDCRWTMMKLIQRRSRFSYSVRFGIVRKVEVASQVPERLLADG
jgi:hypothetical protein